MSVPAFDFCIPIKQEYDINIHALTPKTAMWLRETRETYYAPDRMKNNSKIGEDAGLKL